MGEEKVARCDECGAECCTEQNCKIVRKLVDLHMWAHKSLKDLSHDELLAAHALGTKMLRFLNEQPESSPVKFVALFEVIAVGADELQAENQLHNFESVIVQ